MDRVNRWKRRGSLLLALLLVVSLFSGIRLKAEEAGFEDFDVFTLVQEGFTGGHPAVEKTQDCIYTYDFSDNDGFNSKGIRHAGVALLPDAFTGDFEISAVIEPLAWHRIGTGAVVGVALFTKEGDEPSLQKYFSLVQRGDEPHQITAYHYRFKDGSWGLAAQGTKVNPGENGISEITLRRTGTTITAVVNGEEIHRSSSGEEQGCYPADLDGSAYLGLVWDGCDARISGLKITVGENVLYDQTKDDSVSLLHPEAPADRPELEAADGGVSWNFDIEKSGYDAMVISVQDSAGNLLTASRVYPGETSGTFTFAKDGETELKFTACGVYRSEGELKQGPAAEQVVASSGITAPAVTAKAMGKDTVQLAWTLSENAASYTVEYKRNAEESWIQIPEAPYTEADGKCTFAIGGLFPDTLYDARVILVDQQQKEYASETVSVQTERDSVWLINIFGSSTKQPTEQNIAAGTYDRITENADGTVLIESVGGAGKLQDQHDGIAYYYASVPREKNAALSADITLLYHGTEGKGGDNKQQSFGIMFRDVPNKWAGQSNAFSNMAALAPYDLDKPIRALYRTGVTADSTDGKINKKGLSPDPAGYPVVGATYHMEVRCDNTGFRFRLTDEAGTTSEYVLYHVDVPDLLFQLDPERYYVGFFAAREARILVSNIELVTTLASEDPPAEEKPVEKIQPSAAVTSVTETGRPDYALTFTTNFTGTVTVTKGEETLLEGQKVAAGTNRFDLQLAGGENELVLRILPDAEGQVLTAYDEITLVHTVAVRGGLGENDTIYVSPSASAGGAGTRADPVHLQSAVNCVLPGQTIVLLAGEYAVEQTIMIPAAASGTAEKPIRLTPEGDVTIDFRGVGGGFILAADHWIVENLTIHGSFDNGLLVRGSHNLLDHLILFGNGDTGLQISGRSADTYEMWPSYNTVQYCESYDNSDISEGDADGFAAKLCVGEGNVFDRCSAHHNSDDGWDLYVRNGTPMGPVTVRNCIAYANGYHPDGSSSKGDGNGFKLGGESVAVPHLIENCAAYLNRVDGFTANSNPTFTMKNVTSYANGGSNYTFNDTGEYTVTGAVSVKGGKPDGHASAVKDPSANLFAGDPLAEEGLFVSTEAPENTWYVDETGLASPVHLGDFLRMRDPSLGYGADLNLDPSLPLPESSAEESKAESSVPAKPETSQAESAPAEASKAESVPAEASQAAPAETPGGEPLNPLWIAIPVAVVLAGILLFLKLSKKAK